MTSVRELLRVRKVRRPQAVEGPCLTGALLIGADLRRANLSRACLHDAIVDRNTDFRGTNVSGADLRVNERDGGRLVEARFDNATVYDRDTRFPPGFDPVRLGLSRSD